MFMTKFKKKFQNQVIPLQCHCMYKISESRVMRLRLLLLGDSVGLFSATALHLALLLLAG